jgi:hypothetical protein
LLCKIEKYETFNPVFFCLIIASAIKAQTQSSNSLKLYQHHFNHDNYKKMSSHYYDTSIKPNNNNSVVQIPKPVLTYKGNTNGFDVYQATPDNMFLIKPDSTTAFNMPVKQSFIIMEPVK